MSTKVEIINKPLQIDVYGHSGLKTAQDRDWGAAGFRIMGNMWDKIKTNNIKHKGKNIWVYDWNEKLFTGLELENGNDNNGLLEKREVRLNKYAYYKHIGPYSLLKQAYDAMKAEIARQGLKTAPPFVEIYGHWTNNESKLETEIVMALE